MLCMKACNLEQSAYQALVHPVTSQARASKQLIVSEDELRCYGSTIDASCGEGQCILTCFKLWAELELHFRKVGTNIHNVGRHKFARLCGKVC